MKLCMAFKNICTSFESSAFPAIFSTLWGGSHKCFPLLWSTHYTAVNAAQQIHCSDEHTLISESLFIPFSNTSKWCINKAPPKSSNKCLDTPTHTFTPPSSQSQLSYFKLRTWSTRREEDIFLSLSILQEVACWKSTKNLSCGSFLSAEKLTASSPCSQIK